MAELSQDELEVIGAHPLGKSLEEFRATFETRYVKAENATVTEAVHSFVTKASDRGEESNLRLSHDV